jgi:hypothetical protein
VASRHTTSIIVTRARSSSPGLDHPHARLNHRHARLNHRHPGSIIVTPAKAGVQTSLSSG